MVGGNKFIICAKFGFQRRDWDAGWGGRLLGGISTCHIAYKFVDFRRQPEHSFPGLFALQTPVTVDNPMIH